ncbi:hypothetical protein AM1_4148 [Acaryochloris marina MBIC11017]|uniref:Uncharacterized protein n=1 Tax=Acaryochloris marina (strain MBIC 11017) TaxID=329726 RepID=B0CBL1_ACAM1|nr:hypothetical protein AM1_4148 [Acaryochloris marina MBIC11017]
MVILLRLLVNLVSKVANTFCLQTLWHGSFSVTENYLFS